MSNRKDTRRKFPLQPPCKERLERALNERIHDLDLLWKAHVKGIQELPDLGTLSEYGLAFEFLIPSVNNRHGLSYFRFQLACDGPSDEFRFFASIEEGHWKPYCIEYWYLDWFDSAKQILQGTRLDLMLNIFAWFDESALTHYVYRNTHHR